MNVSQHTAAPATHKIVGRAEPSYPRRLHACSDGPARLYVAGIVPEIALSVALVGARAASSRAMALATRLASGVAEAGGAVVSGGALGIDTAAHRGALAASGPTVVVLPSGLDASYPARNRPLFREVVDGGGAVVSTYAPDAPPRKFHFPQRNRVIAGLADAVVVVEASFASGSLYTSRAATDYGRVLGAVPGSPGCDSLLAQGAAVVESIDDILGALRGAPRLRRAALPASGTNESIVLEALQVEVSASESDLVAITGLPARHVTRAVTRLELEGLALPLPGRNFVRTTLAEKLMGRSR